MSEKEIRENLGRLLDEELKTRDFSFLNHYPEKSAPGKIDGILSKLQDYFSDVIYTPGETDFVEVVRSNAEAERKIFEFYNPISALEYAIDTAKHDKGKDSERKFVQNLLYILKYELRRREVVDYNDSFWYAENRSFWNLANVSWWFAERKFSEQIEELLTRGCFYDLGYRKSEILLALVMPLVDNDALLGILREFYNRTRVYEPLDNKLKSELGDSSLRWRSQGKINRGDLLSFIIQDLDIIPSHIRKAYAKAKDENINLRETRNRPGSFPGNLVRRPAVAPAQVNRANTADNVNATANQETNIRPAADTKKTANRTKTQGNVKTQGNTKTQDNTKVQVRTEDTKTDSLLKKAAELQAAVEENMPNILDGIPVCVGDR